MKTIFTPAYSQFETLWAEYQQAHEAAKRAGFKTMDAITHDEWIAACRAESDACKRADELMRKLNAFTT